MSRSAARPAAAGAWLLAGLGAASVAVVAVIPLAPLPQAGFAAVTILAALVAGRFPGKPVSLMLAALSLAVTSRYLYWRTAETLPGGTAPFLLALGLLLAELYAAATLLLGYVLQVWPLQRGVRPLPDDPALWPGVDVFIPTYNEPMAVVRATALAALAMDWPADRLHVFILDDGDRDECRRLAGQLGCRYLARRDNAGAKAGNLNHALAQTSSPLVAVLDCDHVPTRAFLQLTCGWLLARPRIAVVQTPQHFYSPDPFQRNASARLPAESRLFHFLLQDGGDTWGATLFSGSGAVLRRAALAEIGGFATETLTEDAHTALRLHRRGWESAFVGIPLAAGLAPDRLRRHAAQRARWTRGMLRILRTEHPVLGRGLRFMQRLCYLQATVHFLFPLPRLVFLTAPLGFLLLDQTVVAASPLAVAAYAVPHFVHAIATTARLQGAWRHAFWSEVYEAAVAPALLPAMLATLLRPRRPRPFAVTPKADTLAQSGFDLRTAWPLLLIAALLLAGLLRAGIGLAGPDTPPLLAQALWLNGAWAGLSLLVVLAALAVARQGRPTHPHPSVAAALPVTLTLPDGTALPAQTTRLSQGDGHATAASTQALRAGMDVRVTFSLPAAEASVPAHVLRADAAGIALHWEPRTIEEESALIQAVFGRADTWSVRPPPDRPLRSMLQVVASIAGLFRSRAATGAALLAALAVAGGAAAAQPITPRGKPAPRAIVRPVPQPAPILPPTVPAAPATTPAPAPAPAPEPPPPPAPPPEPEPPPGSVRHVVLNLRQLGAAGALALRGTAETRSIGFGLRGDEVVTAASLTLSGATSPALLPEFSNITVTLNEQYVGTVPARADQPNFTVDLPVSPVFFQDSNRLGFRFAGRYAPDCNDPLSGLLWATVYESSTLTLTLTRLPPQRDLARLPQPFLDPGVQLPLALPVVLPASPGNDTLRTAAIVASWFGAQAGGRGASFPVSDSVPEQGNAVLIVVSGDGGGPKSLPGLPEPTGPTLAVLPNPQDPYASLLVVAGRTGEEAAAAASALAVGNRALGGATAVVPPPALAPRAPYDAPAWIATDRPVKLGELVDAAALQSTGYTGSLHVPFRTAPDLVTWRDSPFPLDVRFRAPPGPIVDVAASRLDVGVNGLYLDTVPLAPGARDGWARRLGDLFAGPAERNQARVGLPTYDLAGSNELQFYFDARPLQRGDCAAIPRDLRMAVDPDSTIDLRSGVRYAELPNLGFFLGAGFPFTRLADLSETAVVLPDRPSAAELGAFLDLMGRMGAATGLAATRVAVTRPDAVSGLADRDLLLIGTLAHLGPAERLLADAPLRLDKGRLALALPTPLQSARHLFGDPGAADRQKVEAVLSAGLAPGTALLVGGESPLAAGRSVVALLADEPASLPAALELLRNPEQAPLVQGDLSLLTGERVTSYRIGAPYVVGHLPAWMWPAWLLRNQPLALAAVALAAAALLGLLAHWLLRRRVTERRDGTA